jgi:GTP cyclohydrolase I
MTTGLALLEGAKASSILEQYDALVFLKGCAHGINEFYGEIPFHLPTLLGTYHIDYFEFGKWCGMEALEQLDQMITTRPRVKHAV